MFRLTFLKIFGKFKSRVLFVTSNVSSLRRRSFANKAILRHYPLANQRFLRSVVVRHLERRAKWHRWPHGQACNTKLATIGNWYWPVLGSTHSDEVRWLFFRKVINVAKKVKTIFLNGKMERGQSVFGAFLSQKCTITKLAKPKAIKSDDDSPLLTCRLVSL